LPEFLLATITIVLAFEDINPPSLASAFEKGKPGNPD
jgi:hypothetical protein